MRYAAEMAERLRPQHYQHRETKSDGHHQRQPFHHPRTSLGATGHWIHLLSVAAPLVIAEVIKDPDKKWRAMRLASVGAAIASEALWTHRLSKDRQKDEESHAALEACNDRCR
jgi:hypothetical protein